MKAYKETTKKSTEELEIPEGVYYFRYTTDDGIEYYKKVTVKPKDDYEVLTCCIQAGAESIKQYEGYIDFDYYTELLFFGGNGVEVIEKDWFEINYKEAIHVLSSKL